MSHAHFDHAQLDSLIVFQPTEYACLLFASTSNIIGPDITTEIRSVQRLLIMLGLLIVAAGLLWPWLSKLPMEGCRATWLWTDPGSSCSPRSRR